VHAKGNVVGVQFLAKFLDPIEGSTSERLLPTPFSMTLLVWHPKAVAYAQVLRDRLDAEDRAKLLRGVRLTDSRCNIPGVDFSPECFDEPGDSEFTRKGLMYLRTRHLQDLRVKPEEWMIPKVICKKGKGSSGGRQIFEASSISLVFCVS
jgi:hypothetical protein